MTHLFIRLLGPFEATLNGRLVTRFHSDKVRALLAYLCVEKEGAHRREKLAGILWPDLPERSARANLRNALANLRQLLGDRSEQKNASPDFLHISRQTIQFNPESDAWVDALAFLDAVAATETPFAELEAAVAQYHGEFMAGFSLSSSSIYEEWLLLQRERFARLVIELTTRLVQTYAFQGEFERAINHAWQQVNLDPLNEKSQRQLMRLLAYNGQDCEALMQYENCRSLLRDDMGVEPSEKTTELFREIRDGVLSVPELAASRWPTFLVEDKASEFKQPPFVARERELDQLTEHLDQALVGHGRVIFIKGEPGSGKTVLADQFMQWAMDQNPDLLAVKGRCNAYTGIGEPFLPFIEMVGMLTGDIETRWAGGEITGQHARRLWKGLPDVLQALIDASPDLIDRFVPSSSLLSRVRVGAPDHETRLKQVLHQREIYGYQLDKENLVQGDLIKQYTEMLQVLSRTHPLILMVDDLQWADSGSIGLLFHLGRRLGGSRILLIGAYRPEEIAMGSPSADFGREQHPLEPVIHEIQRYFGNIFIDLAMSDGREFVEAFLDTEPNRLDRSFREVFYQHTDGHPLFTVELLRGLQVRGDLTKDPSGFWIAKPTLNWAILPPRVEAVIAERINRLPEDKQVLLSAASVEGEVFTAEAVARVLEMDERQVLGWLSGPITHKHQLVQAQELQLLGKQRLSRYRFRHFLFQRYLYTMLDPVLQAHLHQDMGCVLENLYGDHVGELAVSLARHFEAAGLNEKAVEYLRQAGERAVDLFAYDQAVAYYKHGLALVAKLPHTPHRDQMELALQLSLTIPIVALRSSSDSELEETYQKIQKLIKKIEPSPLLFQALVRLKNYHDLRLELQTALKVGQEMIDLAKTLERPDLSVIAHDAIALTLLFLGQAEDYLQAQEEKLSIYHDEYDQFYFNKLGYDPVIDILENCGWALWSLGYPDQARQKYEEAVELAREKEKSYFQAEAFMSASFHYISTRKLPEARKMAAETIAIASEQGHLLNLGIGMCARGWVLAKEGKPDEGIHDILEGLAILPGIRSALIYLQGLLLLADTYCKTEQVSEGLAVVDEALKMAHETGFRIDEPELHRLKGELLCMQGGAECEAEGCFKRAIEGAQGQKAKFWELRATMSLCRLWQQQGRCEAARVAMGEIYDWFTEGFDLPDLIEAKALLKALGG
jgi:DNA-binding SARP family transcriptional activator/predicted ATPase